MAGSGLLLIILVISACGDGGDNAGRRASHSAGAVGNETSAPSPPPGGTPRLEGRLIQVNVQAGRATPRLGTVEVRLGQKVRIEVTADAADEVHVHGYDRRTDLSPGEPASLEFDADIPGTFEVELEKTHLELFELQVR